jgi:RNA polymerase sigma-70 factor, ECF subfamily
VPTGSRRPAYHGRMEGAAVEDRDLVGRARDGEVEAFAEIVRRYEGRVRSVLVRLLDDDRDVEEAVQDCFVRAWRSLDRFRGDSALFTWLYRIAVNEALMRLRRKRLPLAELDERTEAAVPAPSNDPALAAEGVDLKAFLAARIRALEFEYRAPLVLRDVVGLSNQEVADVLDLTVPAAKSRIHRARMQIREQLDRWELDAGGR